MTPPKFQPADGTLAPCDASLRERHLRAFAEAFIEPDRVARWIHSTIEKPAKTRDILSRFPSHRLASRCVEVSGTRLWPETLAREYGDGLGLYLDGRGRSGLTTVAHAATLGGDALFSLDPGRRAVFFFHEGWGWLCAR